MSKASEYKEEVSVIVPVYNRAGIVCGTLGSIKAQTYRPLHLIIVDNGSSDGSLSVAENWKYANESYGFRVTVVSEPCSGAAAARNRGVREVTSDKLMFFDSDDFMYPELIESAMDVFHEDRVGCRMVFWRHRLRMLDGRWRKGHLPWHDLLECQIIHSFLNTSSFMVRKEYLAEVGIWDESLPVWDDYELGIRLLLGIHDRGVARGIDRVLYDVISQDESITGSGFSEKEGDWELSLDRIESVVMESDCPDKGRLVGMLDYRRVILAAHYRREGNRKGALRLLGSVMAGGQTGICKRLLLNLAYFYTSLGFRGAWRVLSVCGGARILRRSVKRSRTLS